MNIKTKHVSNAAGTGQVKATGAGKQRTVTWDHSKSSAWNHGNAAGTLAVAVLGIIPDPPVAGVVNDDGSYVFTVEV